MIAADVMTRTVSTVHPDTTLAELAARMVENHISGMPVVDDAGKLIGVVTEGDLLRRVETDTETHHSGFMDLILGPGRLAADYVRAHGRRVRDVMTEDVVSVTEDAPLAEIVRLMQKKHIKRVPVRRGEAVVGLVSRADLVRVLAAKLAAPCAGDAASDTDITQLICKELAASRWANAHNVSVSVKDGVVSLEGVIFNEAVRPALRVAAENTQGVQAVVDRMVWVEPVTGAALGA
jgi:CBS domain-containing protein